MNQHDMTELVLTASDARDFPDYRQVLARVLLELDARMTTLEVVVNASAKNTGEGRAEEARSGSVTGPSKQPVQARPTGVREDVSVVDEGPVASRQAAPSPASPSPDEVEALARELQRAHHDGAWSDVPLWTASETSQRGYLAEARYVLRRYEPRGARASASAVPMTHPASKTLNECREVFRRVAKRGPCLSSPDLHGIAAVRDFLTLSPEKFRENWGPRDEGDDEKCEGGECRHGFDAGGGEHLIECEKHGGKTSAQPLTGGEGVPSWVPSAEEIQQFIDDGREGDLRALIASRAPAQPRWGAFSAEQHDAAAEALCKDFGHSWTDQNRFRFGQAVNVVLRALGHPAPAQPSVTVEEMAERLKRASKAWGESASINAEDWWLAIARAALATNTPAASGGRDGV